MNTSTPTTLCIAAGGTGGHMFPALSLAKECVKKGWKVHLLTDNRGARFTKDLEFDLQVHIVHAGSPNRKGLFAKFFSLFSIGIGLLQCLFLLIGIRPKVVVGFGGYPSVPPVIAAHMLGKKILLHEQNAVFGRANRFLAKHAHKIALSFDKVSNLPVVLQSKTVVTGNPVREDIRTLAKRAYPKLTKTGKINVLVVGGSLGATVFSDVVPHAIEQLPKTVLKRIHITQQCRIADLPRVESIYKSIHSITHELGTFFKDMPDKLAQAHLVISRSGASTVAELATAGRPSILVPFAQSLDQDQMHNALALQDAGGAVVVKQTDFRADYLAETLIDLAKDPKILQNMAKQAKKHGSPEAAKNLFNEVEKII